jgi:hypothetical protein
MKLFQSYENIKALHKLNDKLYDLDYPIDSELYLEALTLISTFDDLFYDNTTFTSETNTQHDTALKLSKFIGENMGVRSLVTLVRRIFINTMSKDYPKDIYCRYSQFFYSDVRELLASKTKTPLEVLEVLASDTVYFVRHVAQETIARITQNSK